MNNKIIGRRGETAACAYLEKSGYRIIGRNIRLRRLEIDIVAQSKRMVVFFEIKTRRLSPHTDPNVPITSKQIAHLKQAINRYCINKKIRAENTRLDLIIILFKQTGTANLIHYKNIY